MNTFVKKEELSQSMLTEKEPADLLIQTILTEKESSSVEDNLVEIIHQSDIDLMNEIRHRCGF